MRNIVFAAAAQWAEFGAAGTALIHHSKTDSSERSMNTEKKFLLLFSFALVC
jgi:hypothetical protein